MMFGLGHNIEIRSKVKGANKVASAALLLAVVIVIIIGAFLVRYMHRAPDKSITRSGLEAACGDGAAYILVKDGGDYWEISGSEALVSVFSYENWEESDLGPLGEPLLVLRFAETWVLELYEYGEAAAYNNYAASDKRGHAYYSYPEEVLDAVREYIRENGEPHTVGDGTISTGTFVH